MSNGNVAHQDSDFDLSTDIFEINSFNRLKKFIIKINSKLFWEISELIFFVLAVSKNYYYNNMKPSKQYPNTFII